MKQTLHEIAIGVARKGADLQNDDGSMPAGTNPPYNQEETPVSNTARWSTFFLKAYRMTGEDVFREAGKHGMEFLMKDDNKPYGYTYQCRKEGRDQCNGVIGQGLVIKALTKAYDILGENRFRDEAMRLLDVIPFDERKGVWSRIDVDGTDIGIDNTMNHQLAFAASIQGVADESTKANIDIFLNRLTSNLRIYPNGLIKHLRGQESIIQMFLYSVLNTWNRFADKQSNYEYKEPGYHSYNVFRLAELKQAKPDHDFWETQKWEKIRRYTFSEEYRGPIDTDSEFFVHAYFHLGYIEQVLNNRSDEASSYFTKYLNQLYDQDAHLLRRNGVKDPISATGGLHNVFDIPDQEIEL